MSALEQILRSGSEEMNIYLDAAQSEKLLDYLALIYQWNKTYNLSAIRSLQSGVVKHLLDSLSILPHLNATPLLDVGSGAGLPGIVISIMRPNLPITVLDAVGKKCHFMQFAKTQLQCTNLTVQQQRAEVWQPDFCFGQITSRAFASVEKTLKLTQHLLCDNGKYLLLKGVNFAQETLPKNANVQQLRVANAADKRFLITLDKK